MLNVGHGDSIVLEYASDAGTFFGVIDSNRDSFRDEPKALELLRKRGAIQLSFVLLTHPHADHFSGLCRIMEEFPVQTLLTYPLHRDKKRLQSVGNKYLDAALTSGSATIKRHAEEFVKFVVDASKKAEDGSIEWIDIEGPTNRVRPHGFAGVNISAMLPFKKVKGEYYNALDSNRADALESPLQNSLSVALDIEYGDYRISLCGDATQSAWYDHRRELQKANERVSFTVSKLPHHGSAADCSSQVLDYLFDAPSAQKELIGLISAEGSKYHPSPEVLKGLKKRGIKPYCTNLSVVCGNNVRELIADAITPPELIKLLNRAEVVALTGKRRQTPCQGDICVEIPKFGAATVVREFNNACAFRGDLDFLS